MTVVVNAEVGVKVRIEAVSDSEAAKCLEDIRREVQRVANRKVLERRYKIKQLVRYSAWVSYIRPRV